MAKKMRDKEFISHLQKAIEEIDAMETLINSNGEELSNVNKELEDYIHLIENNELNKEQSAYVVSKIHELRNIRRSIKNEFELERTYIENKQKMLGNNTRCLLLTEINKMIKQLDSEYKNRVITEEEYNKILKIQSKRGRPKKVELEEDDKNNEKDI